MSILTQLKALIKDIPSLPLPEQVELLNSLRLELAKVSPFKEHPIDSVQWIPASAVLANDYNPNSVAKPEFELLATSLLNDGFTAAAVVTQEKEVIGLTLVDGFHRSALVKKHAAVGASTNGYIPTVTARSSDKEHHMASTVRHNRARGVHSVEIMSKIIQDLARRGWSNERISKEFGMEEDEILRMKQTLGLAELYATHEFSFSWEPADATD